jgi:cytidylate kinase
VLGAWMDHNLVPHDKYVAYLTRVVKAAVRGGHAVFVGRGAQFLLPRKELLAVRLIASPTYRLQRIIERTGVTLGAAQRRMLEIDRARREFIECIFHHDGADPHLYDLVINVEGFDTAGTLAQIVAAAGRQAQSS